MTEKKLTTDLVTSLLSIIFILAGVTGVILIEFVPGKVISGSFIILGAILLYISARKIKLSKSGEQEIFHDERSAINRLKAADIGFRFYFTAFSVMIFLYALDLFDEIIFVSLTGPVVAAGTVLYFYFYYSYERRGGAEL
ncbi:MAG: hypothetical protein ACFFD4_12095 [Candidatus Odinarchaeota archaeon]